MGYFKTWTVDHGLDHGLDYGLCWASPCIYSFSPCARTVLYVDLTALPSQLVHRPFDLFNTRVHFWAWLCSMTVTSHKSPHWKSQALFESLGTRLQSRMLSRKRERTVSVVLTLRMSYSDDQPEAYKHR